MVGGVVSENLGASINAPIDTVGGAWLSRYSRSQESEADRIGIRTAAEAGYDPAALAHILSRLEEEVASQTGQERRFSISDSHPMTASRLKDIRNRAPTLKPAEKQRVAGDQATLFAKLDGLWWGEDPEAGVFHHDQFLQPVIGFTMTFPAGWKHQNTPQYVISMHPRQEAMLLLGIADPGLLPEVIGGRFIEGMRARTGVEPVRPASHLLGSFRCSSSPTSIVLGAGRFTCISPGWPWVGRPTS